MVLVVQRYREKLQTIFHKVKQWYDTHHGYGLRLFITSYDVQRSFHDKVKIYHAGAPQDSFHDGFQAAIEIISS